ncbi:hypothetical protein COOONC_21180, partial [Cooperia oncophora]
VSIECEGCNSSTSHCVPTAGGNVVCACLPGYEDLNPINPGQNCSKLTHSSTPSCHACQHGSNPCQDYSLHDCDSVAECYSEQPGYFQCRCPKGFIDVSPDKRNPGRKCVRVVDECSLGTHTCDPNADCVDTPEGYTCRCKAGWKDSSRDPLRNPGRVCRKGTVSF